MKRKALRGRSEGSTPPYVTEANPKSNTAIRLYATVSSSFYMLASRIADEEDLPNKYKKAPRLLSRVWGFV